MSNFPRTKVEANSRSQTMEEETAIIMAALSALTPHQLSDLTTTILSLNHHHHHRLATVLSSHTHFSLTLHHLHSLSLHQKTLLIARHLLSSLHHLTLHFHHQPTTTTTTTSTNAINHRDLDAVLLLLLLCETHQHDPEFLDTPSTEWREVLVRLFSDTMLTPQSLIGVYNGGVLIPFIETVARCWKFIGAMGSVGVDGGGGGGGGKEGREVAASPAAVVALPSVEVSGDDATVECVICKEEMSEGREVCELPCQHLFHWLCILPWLRKRNTCPCCRSRLPTDDVLGEIERLWAVLIKFRRIFDGESP